MKKCKILEEKREKSVKKQQKAKNLNNGIAVRGKKAILFDFFGAL